MKLITEMLFDQPQRPIIDLISKEIESCEQVSIVAGFLTEDGIALFFDELRDNPSKLSLFIVGAGTLKAFDAFDKLIAAGIDRDKLRVHLGFSRRKSSGTWPPFVQFHPMLHTKLYFFTMPDGTSSAIIGSHNVTVHALAGLNGEASVRIEGDSTDPIFSEVSTHIKESSVRTEVYDPSMKRAYAWWYKQYFQGVMLKVLHGKADEDIENIPTIVIFSQMLKAGSVLSPGDIIYIEMPEEFRQLKSLDSPVHLYVTDSLPPNPQTALALIGSIPRAYRTKVSGTNEQQIIRGRANWVIRDIMRPIIEPAPFPLDIKPRNGFLQVFLEVTDSLRFRYEYIFQRKPGWDPVLDDDMKIQLDPKIVQKLEKWKVIPPERYSWSSVKALVPSEFKIPKLEFMESALKSTSPDSGSFVLYSPSRKRILE